MTYSNPYSIPSTTTNFIPFSGMGMRKGGRPSLFPGSGAPAYTGPEVFGSTRASTFVKDLKNGVDSLDVLVIGDSNGGQNEWGYTAGMNNALGTGLSITSYATPLLAGGRTWGSGGTDYDPSPAYERMAGVGVYHYSDRDNVAGGTGSNVNQRLMLNCPTDTNGNDALKSNLGFNSTNATVTFSTLMPQQNRYIWNPTVVASAGIFCSAGGTTNALRILTTSPLVSAARSARYRVVHGTYASGSGQFKALISNAYTTAYATSSYVPTYTGTVGYQTANLPYTTSSTPTELWCTWDGGYSASTNSRLVTGPFACLWHSFSVSVKGYSVTNLTTSDNRSTTQLAAIVEGIDKVLDSALTELRVRQELAGGTGRLLIFCNSGVNGGEDGAAYTAAIARIRDRIAARWVSTGGNLANLAFVFSVTTELNPSYGSGQGGYSWLARRPGVSSAAASYAVTNAGDGNGVCVVDTSVNASYAYLTSNSYYNNNTTDQIHLKDSGYNAVSLVIANALKNA